MTVTKNRPSWRLRDRRGRRKGEAVPLPVPCFDLRDAPRCRAKRRDGEPCRAPAMQGATTCRCHGGHLQAHRSAARLMGKERVYSVRSAVSSPREALARIGVTEPYPPGVHYAVSPLVRGLVIEAYRNRETAPEYFLLVTKDL